VKLSTELVKRQHSVSVATSFRSLDRQEAFKGVGISKITPLATLYSVPHSLSFPLRQISKLAGDRNIEIIHALMDYSTNTAASSLVSEAKSIPFVYNVQGMGTRTGRFIVDALAEYYDWTVERFISNNAEKLILLSKSLISRTRKLGVPDSKVAVIPSGVDSRRFDPHISDIRRRAAELRNKLSISQDEVVIGFVGRLVPAKGLLYLLSAVKQLLNEFPNIVLLIVGDGPQKTELQSVAKSLGLKTVFPGYQSNTPPYYALMDVFVLPSFFEGLPGVVLEAMAMEKPVVATNVGGTSDLILDGENGFLVRARAHEQIVTALKELVGDKDLRLKMGRTGRQLVLRNFLWEDIVDKVETVYKEAI
jgi:glycosyltransferase involved in cell wall biosynthesis